MSNTAKHADPLSMQDIHRQEEEYKKSVTVILWYEANASPIRINQTIPTFPYFKLSEMTNIVAELRLTPSTYLEIYNPETGQWDQLRITSVRKVESQQRLLYRIRKSLLEGLKDSECLQIDEELKIQRRFLKSFRSYSDCSASATSAAAKSRGESSSHRCICKRGSIDIESDSDSPTSRKVRIPNNFYLTQQSIVRRREDHHHADADDDERGYLSADNGTTAPAAATSPTAAATATSTTTTISGSLSAASGAHAAAAQSLPTPPSSSSSNVSADDFTYPGAIYDVTSTSGAPATSSTQPGCPSSSTAATTTTTTLSNSPSSIPIPISPYPPHPPLKRWPNDYTVAEISAGFNAMDALVAQSANGSTMTHKAAFERVFGSRYVKSTVCRHRGVWKRAHVGVKTQYEAMGHDDRAYWGEFVRHVEGRPSSLRNNSGNLNNPTPTANVSLSHQGITEEDEDQGGIDEAQCMKSLQNSQAMPTMDAYESSLASLGTTAHS
ncbi:hypothetical protein AGABI2DRAFT_196224 [Agaricus bisporus var. bisporus H97]|uniref:hypothetical protein n=1 Tax=Agaricus bisporus var. bisporus (strain H97 / ATCC MYA-4626 / FGSC 10389) TaxID=936046 RepID=UPI00029F6AC7|nr:hypothetical protein AGABI2DRAFT_196224 [Agaricus bisporus var. bisporus H97]EKV41734.1 hypothetical protein AGABI2DRAFT_196224 [Agaricus bisporus var. bisporus H97]